MPWVNKIILEGPKGMREIEPGTPYGPGERVVGTTKSFIESKNVEDMKKVLGENYIPLGDALAAITSTTGFKKWWDAKHNGECVPCQERQATANYLKFRGPQWLAKWVKDNK